MEAEKLTLALEKEIIKDLLANKEAAKEDIGLRYLEYNQREIDYQLMVAREALTVLMGNFSTFRPILRKVRCAYELALDAQNSRLEGYIKLTHSLLGLGNTCKDPASNFREIKNMVLNNLEKERSMLHTTIESLKYENERKQFSIKELKKKLESSKKQTKRELESRQFVLSDLIKLEKEMNLLQKRIKLSSRIEVDDNFRSHEMKNMTENEHPRIIVNFPISKDPIVLQEALSECQEAILELSTQLCALKAKYAEVVPQKKLEATEDLLKALKNEKYTQEELIISLKKENEKLSVFRNVYVKRWRDALKEQEANSIIKNENKSLLNKIDDLENGSSIISSQWRRCAKYIPGGMKRWEKLSAGKTNSQKLELLAKEFEIMVVASSYYEENVIFT